MPLDNTAKLPDIITALQNMQGVNGKADLASVIGSPATSEDTMAMMVGHIQSAKNELAAKMGGDAKGTDSLRELAGDLVIGKKWAEGTHEIQNKLDVMKVNNLDFNPDFFIYYTKPEVSSRGYGIVGISTTEMNVYGMYAGWDSHNEKFRYENQSLIENGKVEVLIRNVDYSTGQVFWIALG